jgi:hypothetical protein
MMPERPLLDLIIDNFDPENQMLLDVVLGLAFHQISNVCVFLTIVQ